MTQHKHRTKGYSKRQSTHNRKTTQQAYTQNALIEHQQAQTNSKQINLPIEHVLYLQM